MVNVWPGHNRGIISDVINAKVVRSVGLSITNFDQALPKQGHEIHKNVRACISQNT